jgi:hypothetical protein
MEPEGSGNIGNDPVQAEQGDYVGLNMECSKEMQGGNNVQLGECTQHVHTGEHVSADNVWGECTQHVHTGEQISADHVTCKPEAVCDNGSGSCDKVQKDSTFHIKAELLDRAEAEECDYTGIEEHDHSETNRCDHAGMEGNFPIKTELCDRMESDPCYGECGNITMTTQYCDRAETDPCGYVGMEQHGEIPIKTEPYDQIETEPCDQTQTETYDGNVKFEPSDPDIDHVKHEIIPDAGTSTVFWDGNPSVYVFPEGSSAADTARFKQEEQGMTGSDYAVREESATGMETQLSDFVAPHPGQLPIHVVDPLHGDGVKMEEEAVRVTGVVANIHTQVSEYTY